jgi:hypothetical protein
MGADMKKWNWKIILQYVLICSGIIYFWVSGFYFVLSERAEAACIQEGTVGAHLANLVVYCEVTYQGDSYIIPLTKIRELKAHRPGDNGL